MNRINRMLQQEAERLLGTNPFPLPPQIGEKITEILDYESDLSSWKIDAKELEESFLTPTLIYIAKIEKLFEQVRAAWLEKLVVQLNFTDGVSFHEFFEYFGFQDDESASVDAVLEATTSLFQKNWTSSAFPWVRLLHQELYEHEDDTDEWNYFIILSSSPC